MDIGEMEMTFLVVFIWKLLYALCAGEKKVMFDNYCVY